VCWEFFFQLHTAVILHYRLTHCWMKIGFLCYVGLVVTASAIDYVQRLVLVHCATCGVGCYTLLAWYCSVYWKSVTVASEGVLSGFLRSGNFEWVRESQGKQRGSGKSQGILKYRSLDQLFMHYFHNFCWLLGALLPPPPGLRPCKHCRLVYIAIFYNGTKFSITFVYLVLFY